jgi:hypothetical protein
MGDGRPGPKGEQLEEHSLPGTNQAGTGPDDCEDHSEQPHHSRAQASRQQEQLEKHSLPGTNQAGKSGDDTR